MVNVCLKHVPLIKAVPVNQETNGNVETKPLVGYHHIQPTVQDACLSLMPTLVLLIDSVLFDAIINRLASFLDSDPYFLKLFPRPFLLGDIIRC
ncbi:hypothetical protein V6N13_084655 [Hibiscus sabdariffa]